MVRGFREADRRVATRAWKHVRSPSLPAMIWLLVDVFVGDLIVITAASLVVFASEDAGQLVRVIGLAAAVAGAIVNFIRSTRPVASDGTNEG